MTVNPTQYDVGQDARLTDLESLVRNDYTPPAGAEFSYPIVGKPLSDQQWQFVTLGMGSGILDEGGMPYWLRNLDNTTDTAKLTVSNTKFTAQAVIRGFYHRLMQDVTIPLPAVSATTVYNICLTYDPTQHSNPNGPIRVVTYAGAPDTTQGKVNLLLWQVTRNASQLLTDALVVQKRPKIAPTLTVDTRSQLPAPNTVLWGTIGIIHKTGELVRAWSDTGTTTPDQWFSITDPAWTPIQIANAYTTGSGIRQAMFRVKDGFIETKGRITRNSGTFALGQSHTVAYLVSAEGDGAGVATGAASSSSIGAVFYRVELTESGSGKSDNITVWPNNSGQSWLDLDGLRFRVRN